MRENIVEQCWNEYYRDFLEEYPNLKIDADYYSVFKQFYFIGFEEGTRLMWHTVDQMSSSILKEVNLTTESYLESIK